jgi:Neuraminidase (sialidase)
MPRLSRRRALAGGSTAALGALLAPAVALAHADYRQVEPYAPPRQIRGVDHQVVYRREDEFTGWVHTMGFWNMGDGELLQMFPALGTDYDNAAAINHDAIGRSSTTRKLVAVRSEDWGRTWDGDDPVINPYDTVSSGSEGAETLADLGPIDYLDPNVLVSANSTDFAESEGRSWIRISRDRGHSWSPLIAIPLDGLSNLSSRESVLVRPDGTVLSFMMEVLDDARNRHPLVYALPPGGDKFHFLSAITPLHDPKGATDSAGLESRRFRAYRWFYPRGYLLANGRILCCMRSQRDPRGVMWSEVWHSEDGGGTWDFLSRVNDFGAPASLVVMPDGRVVAVYGYRLMPSGIRAKVSEDGGASWGPELIVRDDGGSWDLGYPNAWATNDGRVGVIYYFNSKDDRIDVNGGVRHIARSIFAIE